MRYLLLTSTFMLLSYNYANASSNDFEVNLGTHTHLPQLELNSPPLNPNGAYKTAAICALGNAECGMDVGFSKSDKDTTTGAKKCRDAGYNTTSCSAPKILGAKCKFHPAYFASCNCPSAVGLASNEYCTQRCDSSCINKASCPTNQIHTADGNSCYQPQCSEGGYSASVPSNNKCSSTTYYGRTCYHSCYQPQCSEGGYSASVPSNNKCSSTSYYGHTCYYGCYQPACSEGGYNASVPTNNLCSSVSFYGRTCYNSCYQPQCSAGGYLASIPANNACSSTTYYGRACYYSCYQPTCSVGGYVDSVPANNKCSSTSYYGRTCYYGCYQPACSEGGYNASIPTNNLCSSTSYYGRTCYHSCYQPQCSAGGYLASIPAGQNCTAISYYGNTCYHSCYNLCTHSCTGQTTPCSSSQVQTSSCNGCGTMYYNCRARTCSDGGYDSSSGYPGYTCKSVVYSGMLCYTCTRIPCYERPITKYCNGNTYCCGGGATNMSCSDVIIGVGGCMLK